jgi:MSHA biogenesis protein MshI
MDGPGAAVLLRSGKRPGSKPLLQQAVTPAERGSLESLAPIGKKIAKAGVPIAVVLGRSDYRILRLDKPSVRPDEVEQSLRWALTPLIDYPVAEANLSWVPIPSQYVLPGRPEQVYLICCKRSLADGLNQRFALAHLSLEAIDVRETAHRNIARLLRKNSRAICLVTFEKNGVQITVTLNGDLLLERFIRESFSAESPSESKDAKNDESAQLDRIALEVQRTFDFIRREFNDIKVDRVAVTPTAYFADVQKKLSARLSEPVEDFRLSDILHISTDVGRLSPESESSILYAIGVSLRS